MTASRVLIISGPIASGKSTTAYALAAESRASGATAAVVELDRVYMMLDDSPVMSDRRTARRARRAVAALVDQYVLDGIDLVTGEGDFWITSERDEFTSRLSSGVAAVFVTLRVSV
jgi:adenylylsulfate kinase-like enzyme